MWRALDVEDFDYIYTALPRSGSAKWTWKAKHPEESDEYLAIKLHKKKYRDANHARRSEREFSAYNELRETQFKTYVPAPYSLVFEKGKIIGYSVEWFDGRSASPSLFNVSRNYLTTEHFQNLRAASMSLLDLGIIIDSDAMEPYNWMINSNGDLKKG
jgi:hypothetical protein